MCEIYVEISGCILSAFFFVASSVVVVASSPVDFAFATLPSDVLIARKRSRSAAPSTKARIWTCSIAYMEREWSEEEKTISCVLNGKISWPVSFINSIANIFTTLCSKISRNWIANNAKIESDPMIDRKSRLLGPRAERAIGAI